MITPPLSISARPALTVNVASSRGVCGCSLIGCECNRALAVSTASTVAPRVVTGGCPGEDAGPRGAAALREPPRMKPGAAQPDDSSAAVRARLDAEQAALERSNATVFAGGTASLRRHVCRGCVRALQRAVRGHRAGPP